MAEAKRLICRSLELPECGRGARFSVDIAQGMLPEFVVRHQGKVHGYVNRCAHKGAALDAQPGAVFDCAGLYLVCATHGALYYCRNRILYWWTAQRFESD